MRRTPAERSDELEFSLPADLARYVVEKGSIAVDGVSLTVADVTDDTFVVALIPTTLSHTTLGVRKPGDTVKVEVQRNGSRETLNVTLGTRPNEAQQG